MWSWATTKEHNLRLHVLFTITVTDPQFRLQKWSHKTIMLNHKSVLHTLSQKETVGKEEEGSGWKE